MSRNITTEFVKLGPADAEALLGHNVHNRGLRDRHVNKLKGAIERGEWKVNGDTIRIAKDGTLLDGQHRLWAIVLAEKTEHYDGKGVQVMIMRGLDMNVQPTIDTDLARRSLADNLRLRGYTSNTMLAAAINVKWKLDNGLIRANTVPTVQQALEVLKEHPGLVEACAMSQKWRVKFHGTAGVGVLWYEFAQIDPDAADTFFTSVIEGVNLAKTSPLYALRRQAESGKTSSIMLMALIIKAWNAYIEGREVTLLSWRPVGKQAEAFPKIAGQ